MSPAKKAATASLQRDAELMRLARAFGVDQSELALLDGADETALRQLRLSVTDRLFAISANGMTAPAALASKVPAALSATLAEKALGPVLSARMVPHVDTKAIPGIAQRLSAEFLADSAVHLDLRHAAPLISAIPQDKLEQAGAVLAEREEFVVLAAFVGYLDVSVLRGLLSVFDAETLLQAAFLVEQPDRIDALLSHLDDDRLDALLQAARTSDLWVEALSMFTELGVRQQTRFVSAFHRLGPEALAEVADEMAGNKALAAAAKPLLKLLNPATRRQVTAKLARA